MQTHEYSQSVWKKYRHLCCPRVTYLKQEVTVSVGIKRQEILSQGQMHGTLDQRQVLGAEKTEPWLTRETQDSKQTHSRGQKSQYTGQSSPINKRDTYYDTGDFSHFISESSHLTGNAYTVEFESADSKNVTSWTIENASEEKASPLQTRWAANQTQYRRTDVRGSTSANRWVRAWLEWLRQAEHRQMHRKVTGWSPVGVREGGNRTMFLSYISPLSLPSLLPSHPFSLKINETVLGWGVRL